MKKMISTLLSTIIIVAAASSAKAQTGDKAIAFIPAKNHAAYVAFINQYNHADESALVTGKDGAEKNAATKASLKAIKANDKALKNFKAIYKKSAPDANWYVQDNAIIASFDKDNVKTSVVYNKNGKWFHTLTYYPEDKTPADIASIMDYAYPKDEVKLSVKVEEGNKEFYIVQLEGKTTLKKVTVYDGEVNVIEELTKAN